MRGGSFVIIPLVLLVLAGCDNRMAVRLGSSDTAPEPASASSFIRLSQDNSSLKPEWYEDEPEPEEHQTEPETPVEPEPEPEPVITVEPEPEPTGPSREEQIDALTQPIYFRLDEYSLNAQYIRQLEDLAVFLNEDENLSMLIRIEGHCDDRGTREYNFALGSARASAIATVLMRNNVNKNRIKTISFGKERPRYAGTTPLSRSRNRRGDIILSQ